MHPKGSRQRYAKDEKEDYKMDNGKVTSGFKWAWASRAVSLAVNMLFIGYFTYYCTDIVGLSATLVGTLLLATKLFDGVTDIIAGFIIDRTNTRLGKARPYQFVILPVWVLTIMLFSVPDIGVTGQCVYIFILYTLIYAVFATLLNTSDAVCLALCVQDPQDRVKVTSFAAASTMLFCSITGIILPQLIKTWGTTHKGWTMMALVFGIPLGLVGTLRFFLCKERAVSNSETVNSKPVEERIPFKESVRLILQNKYIFILSGMLFFFYLYNGISTTIGTYYYKYIFGNVGIKSLMGLTSFITPVIIMFVPRLCKKLGTVPMLRYGLILGCIGMLIRTIGGPNIVTLFIGSFCAQIAILPISSLINIYIVDCMDYGEWKTGKRIDGLVSSFTAFAKKIGGGLASAGVGLIMGAAGYVGTADVQTSSAYTAIVALFTYVPLAIFIIMLILSYVYNIDKLLPQIKADLKKSHQK